MTTLYTLSTLVLLCILAAFAVGGMARGLVVSGALAVVAVVIQGLQLFGRGL